MSGHAWHGGMLDLRTYLLISASRQGGQIRRATPFAVQPHLEADFLHEEHLGTPVRPSSVNPSKERPPRKRPSPKPTPRIKTASINKIRGVNLTGIIEVISPLLIAACIKIIILHSPPFPRNRRTSHLFRDSRVSIRS